MAARPPVASTNRQAAATFDPAAAAPGRRRPGAGRGRGRAVRPSCSRSGWRPGQPARADGGHRDQPGRRRRPRVAARGGDLALALGARRMAARQRHHPQAARGGDAGLGDGARHRQDRHPDRGPHGRPARCGPRRRGEVSGNGYAPTGHVHRTATPLDRGRRADLARCCWPAALCNDAALRPPTTDGTGRRVGDPTEAALLAAAAPRLGLDQAALRPRSRASARCPSTATASA